MQIWLAVRKEIERLYESIKGQITLLDVKFSFCKIVIMNFEVSVLLIIFLVFSIISCDRLDNKINDNPNITLTLVSDTLYINQNLNNFLVEINVDDFNTSSTFINLTFYSDKINSIENNARNENGTTIYISLISPKTDILLPGTYRIAPNDQSPFSIYYNEIHLVNEGYGYFEGTFTNGKLKITETRESYKGEFTFYNDNDSLTGFFSAIPEIRDYRYLYNRAECKNKFYIRKYYRGESSGDWDTLAVSDCKHVNLPGICYILSDSTVRLICPNEILYASLSSFIPDSFIKFSGVWHYKGNYSCYYFGSHSGYYGYLPFNWESIYGYKIYPLDSNIFLWDYYRWYNVDCSPEPGEQPWPLQERNGIIVEDLSF